MSVPTAFRCGVFRGATQGVLNPSGTVTKPWTEPHPSAHSEEPACVSHQNSPSFFAAAP